MTKQQTIEKLKQQMPSFYSLEQVIEIVAGIDCGSSITEARIEKAMNAAREAIRDAVRGFNPSDHGYELEISNGNEVYISSIDLDESTFADPVEDAIREAFGVEQE